VCGAKGSKAPFHGSEGVLVLEKILEEKILGETESGS
jgi:hypothetical protein